MNETYTAEQKQIFDVPLEGADAEAIKALVDKHKANAALTQQMALDASRLVSTSQERLAKQAEAGFFKRLASALSGKTSENQLLNQKDMLQMQKFAWHYLQQLQQQNLINAQSIAVIRNNLGTMNEYIIETRDFLEQAIEKIDHRLRHVEKNTNFNNWALNIESNKRRFKSTPKNLLILRLTYDFMRSHRDLVLTDRDVSNYLVTTLEKLDINCDENVRLLDFISELIDQVEVVGIDQYRAMIELSFDEHSVNSEYIQKNISGIGFNALYFLSDNYDKIVDLIGDNELCNSDEAREKIISKFFGNEFSGLSTAYGVRNLVCEVIGGSQIAIDIYREEHGLNVVQEEIAGESQPEVVKLVSSLPDVQAHTFLDNNNGGESNRNYLLLLALCIENAASLNELAQEFIELLAKKSGFPDMLKVILELADNQRKHVEYQPVMQALLDDDDKKYTWLLDAFFLLKLANKEIESPRIKGILDILKPFQAKECIPNMLMMINGSDESQVMDAVTKLATHTQGWRNIIRYRELRFDKCFDEVLKQLYSASLAINRIGLEMTTVYGKASEYAVYFNMDGGSFFSNLADKAASAVYTLGRRSALSSLNDIRKKGAACVLENRSALFRANSLISRWGMPDFEFKDEIDRSDFDLNNSAENEDWDRQFNKYYYQVERTLDSFSSACDDAAKQLELFVKGNFHQSVLKLREIEHAEYLRQQQLEKLEKQSVTIVKNGAEHFFSIEWRQVKNPPCDPEKVQDIKTDGKVWFIVAKLDSDEVFYRSEDGMNWQQVQIDTTDKKFSFNGIDVVNGMWMIKNREYRDTRPEGIYYSSDALTWHYSCGPGGPDNNKLSLYDGCLSYENVIYFNGMWLWTTTQSQKYSYIEKGFFSDSTKTDSYRKTIIFCAKTLDGPWERWDKSPSFSEGVKVNAIYSLPGRDGLLAFCEYDYSYIKNKIKPEESPFVMYYGAAKSWQKCTWGVDLKSYHRSSDHMFVLIGGNLMCFDGWSCEILTSDKGYEWLLTDIKLDSKCTGYCALNDLNLFISRNNSSIYLSQDANSFNEIKLEDGNWNHITANVKGIFGVYNANSHEATVLRVGSYICQPKKVSQA